MDMLDAAALPTRTGKETVLADAGISESRAKEIQKITGDNPVIASLPPTPAPTGLAHTTIVLPATDEQSDSAASVSAANNDKNGFSLSGQVGASDVPANAGYKLEPLAATPPQSRMQLGLQDKLQLTAGQPQAAANFTFGMGGAGGGGIAPSTPPDNRFQQRPARFRWREASPLERLRPKCHRILSLRCEWQYIPGSLSGPGGCRRYFRCQPGRSNIAHFESRPGRHRFASTRSRRSPRRWPDLQFRHPRQRGKKACPTNRQRHQQLHQRQHVEQLFSAEWSVESWRWGNTRAPATVFFRTGGEMVATNGILAFDDSGKLADNRKTDSIQLSVQERPQSVGRINAPQSSPVTLAYAAKKEELQKLKKEREVLSLKTFQEGVETKMPMTTSVEVIEHAEAEKAPSRSLGESLGSLLSGKVERRARIKVNWTLKLPARKKIWMFCKDKKRRGKPK